MAKCACQTLSVSAVTDLVSRNLKRQDYRRRQWPSRITACRKGTAHQALRHLCGSRPTTREYAAEAALKRSCRKTRTHAVADRPLSVLRTGKAIAELFSTVAQQDILILSGAGDRKALRSLSRKALLSVRKRRRNGKSCWECCQASTIRQRSARLRQTSSPVARNMAFTRAKNYGSAPVRPSRTLVLRDAGEVAQTAKPAGQRQDKGKGRPPVQRSAKAPIRDARQAQRATDAVQPPPSSGTVDDAGRYLSCFPEKDDEKWLL